MNNKKKLSIFKYLALVSQIGISMLVPILGGIYIGNRIDNWLGTKVIFLIIFSVFGIISSFVTLFKITNKDFKRK